MAASTAYRRIGTLASLLLALAASAVGCSRNNEPGDAESSAGAPNGSGGTPEGSGGGGAYPECPLEKTGTISPITSMIIVNGRMIYTENSGFEVPGAVSSVDVATGDFDILFDSPHPKGLMNVEKLLVWISAMDDGGIERDSLVMGPITGGVPVQIVSTQRKVESLALTDTHVYWTDGEESLWRAELAADSEPEAVLTARQVTGVAADRDQNLFVTALAEKPVLYRLDKDSLEPTALVEGDLAAGTVSQLTVAGDFIYFRLDLSGAKGLRRTSISTPSDRFEAFGEAIRFSKLASDGSNVYFSGFPSGTSSTTDGVVGRVDRDGEPIVLKEGLYQPFAVASIGKCLYYNAGQKLGVVATR